MKRLSGTSDPSVTEGIIGKKWIALTITSYGISRIHSYSVGSNFFYNVQ